MLVNIISKYNSFAMNTLTDTLRHMPGFEVEISDKHNPEADLNYHVPYHFIMEDDAGTNAILYTHTNPGHEAGVAEAASRADLVMAMSFTGREELLSYGVPAEKIWVANIGTDQFMARRFNIGVVGSLQPNGRKRPQMLLDIFYGLPKDMRHFVHFMIVGNGWEPYVEQLQAAGASVSHAPNVEHKDLQAAYHQMDLLLVPSYIEGGPMPLLEAMKCGTDVLSSNVGYARDLLGDDHLFYTLEGCIDKLSKRVQPRLDRHHLGSLYTWTDWMLAHAGAFSRLLGTEMPRDDKFGVGRYNQLIELIAENKSRWICEVGTWTGFRAVEMIQEAQKHNDHIQYTGFDLFETMTETQMIKEVSKAGVQGIAVNKRICSVSQDVKLWPGDTCKSMRYLTPDHADLYFIDGGHSEETILSDWENIQEKMYDKSIVVFDDYYHDGPEGAGCNAVIDNLNTDYYNVEHLPFVTETDNSGQMLRVSMVKVTYRG